MSEGPDGSQLARDYEAVRQYFIHLSDVRFKLLAALPVASLAGLVIIPSHAARSQQLASGLLGFAVTIALAIYDQRNTQIYDRLVRRAKWLEGRMGFRSCTGSGLGGAFRDRPPRRRIRRWDVLWHDLALAIVYGASLAGWCFVALRALLNSASSLSHAFTAFVVVTIFAAALTVFVRLARQNDRECAEPTPENID
jgi:hypothetical protein